MYAQFTKSILCIALVGMVVTGCASGIGGAGEQKPLDLSSSANRGVDNFAALPNAKPDVKVKPQAAELFQESLEALAAEDLARAEGLLSQVTKIQPELSGPWLNLGQVYLADERATEARSAFEQAIAANPTNCAAYNQLGVLERKEGALEKAESSYLACIKRNPDFPQVYLNLGILYELYLGRLPDALTAYRTYQRLIDEEDSQVNGWVIDLERRL